MMEEDLFKGNGSANRLQKNAFFETALENADRSRADKAQLFGFRFRVSENLGATTCKLKTEN